MAETMLTDPAATPGGPVDVCPGVTLFCGKLSQDGEYALYQTLRRLADQQAGPGGVFARAASQLKWLREQGLTAEWEQAVRELVRLQAAGPPVSDDAWEAARRSPEGVAAELYHRTRQAHPDWTLERVRAVVTEANAGAVLRQMAEAVADRGKASTPSASPATSPG